MYYKLKVTKKGFKFISKVERIGRDNNKDYLYLTQDEIDLLSPDAIDGYTVTQNLNSRDLLYENLNKM